MFTNSPSSASFGANATECSSRCSLPNFSPTVLKTLAISSSLVTSHGRMSVSAPNVPAEFLDVFLEAFALVGEGEFRARFVPGLRDGPGDGAFVGDAEDDSEFSREQET